MRGKRVSMKYFLEGYAVSIKKLVMKLRNIILGVDGLIDEQMEGGNLVYSKDTNKIAVMLISKIQINLQIWNGENLSDPNLMVITALTQINSKRISKIIKKVLALVE